MLLFLRRIRRNFFANKQFQNYLLYALGEIVLVVIGILVALQIDNWNDENKREHTLVSYLNTIARNIDDDLAEIKAIRTKREAAYELSLRENSSIGGKVFFTRADIAFAAHALAQAQQLHYFNANTSGYEALKSSGVLDRLQGRDVENLLYDYYDTVSRIAHNEQNHNEYVRLLSLQVVTKWPDGLEQWEFEDPMPLAEDRFQALQPLYSELLNNPSTGQLYMRAQRPVAPLLRDYDRLERLGEAFTGMAETGRTEFDATIVNSLASIYDPNAGIGDPNVVADGQVSWQSYDLTLSDSNDWRVAGSTVEQADETRRQRVFRHDSFVSSGDSLHIVYPGGADWAGIWIIAPFYLGSGDQSLDFSGFEKLQLELKGDLGGEKILLNMEDADDPKDGTSTRYELQLTDQWQTYEIDLAEFETADLGKLQAILGFVFLQEPQSFSVRTVRFLDSE